jgi:hypothetical protein
VTLLLPLTLALACWKSAALPTEAAEEEVVAAAAVVVEAAVAAAAAAAVAVHLALSLHSWHLPRPIGAPALVLDFAALLFAADCRPFVLSLPLSLRPQMPLDGRRWRTTGG